jgi:protein involved in polysaccharide export with SLBB domain
MRKILCFAFWAICLYTPCVRAFGQVNAAIESAARAQLSQRGISEEELRAKLIPKGVDMSKVTPDQLSTLQPTIEQAIKEIESERRGSGSDNQLPLVVSPVNTTIEPKPGSTPQNAPAEVKQLAAKVGQEVINRVDEGATIEEAVAESLTDEGKKQGGAPQLGIYGQEIFRNKSLDIYRTTKDARPTENYLLGVGDEIGVVIFGASQGDFRYVINEEGYISAPGVGKVFLKGVPYGKAKNLMQARFQRAFVFREDQFVMSLATARTITVNIFGEVANYGSFTISAVNTAFNAIAVAGGPNAIGSVRNIKVIHNGKSKNLDVYDFMNNPALQYEFFLEHNDVIHIPVAEKVVTISGEVKRPMTYELKDNESLDALVKFAGGLTADAYQTRVQIKRSMDNKVVLLDIDMAKSPNYALLNGDVIIVGAIPKENINQVSVSGDVSFPGTFALEANLDLAALIFKSQPKRTARKDLAFVIRTNVDGTKRIMQVSLDEIAQGKNQPFILEPFDQLLVFKQERYIDGLTVSLSGAVRDAKTQPFLKGFKLSEYLQLSGGLRDDATDFGYVLRTPVDSEEKSYLRINPKKALIDPKGAENIELNGNDVVRVFSTKEFRDDAEVKISGAVRDPVSVPYGSALTLSDLIKLSGGLRIEASKVRIDIYRLLLEENVTSRTLAQSFSVEDRLGNIGQDVLLAPFDEIIVRTIPDFSLIKKVRIDGEVKYPGEYGLTSPNERLSDVIMRAGGLTAEAFPLGGFVTRVDDGVGVIVTRMDMALKKKGSHFDLILKPGDVINLPKSLDLVTIYTKHTNATEVLSADFVKRENRINVAYQAGKRGRWYVREFAGGRTGETSYRKLKVQYPNGHIKRSLDLGLFALTPKVKPGSKIILPLDQKKEKAPKVKEPSKPVDWDKAFTQILTFSSTVATMVLAIAALRKL